MAIGTKLALPKKDMTLWTVTCGVHTSKELAAESQLTYQEVKILTCEQYPNTTPKGKGLREAKV